jgi:hypothetical protein
VGIIDQDGRLFGRLHLIDLAAIIGVCLLAVLFVLGYRLYSSNYRKLVRQEFKDEIKTGPPGAFVKGGSAKVVVVLYAKMPRYLRQAVSIGDRELKTAETGFPLKILAIRRADGKPGAYFVLLGGEVGVASTGVFFAGIGRAIRLGETLAIATRKYRVTGTIVRILPGDADPSEFASFLKRIPPLD